MSPSMRPPRPLADQDIEARVRALADWRVEAAHLVREVRFGSFMEGIDFVNRVAEAAESMDHHPDILISWRRVTLRLTSHDAHGITARDFALAERIDALIASDAGGLAR